MLDHFLYVIQAGYRKYSNPYHNHCHAAEVLQTVHYMLSNLEAAVSYQINYFLLSGTYCAMELWKVRHPSTFW